jgi:RNA polymerase sigma factor (sigma-70 family)
MAKAEAENVRDALVSRAVADSAAFGLLYDIYYEKIFSYCASRVLSRQIAEDLTSTTFLSAAQNISRFKGKTRTEFVNWLYTIATAKIDLYLKKQLPEAPDFESDIITWPLLHSVILRLNQKDQVIVILRFFENFTVDRISEITGLRPDAVRIKIAEAIERLRKILKMQIDGTRFPNTEKQFEELVKKLDIDNIPDIAHKGKLRAKISSTFNQPETKKYQSILYPFAGAVFLIALGLALWFYPADKAPLIPQGISKLPKIAAEVNLPPEQEEVSRLEKIKNLASEGNIPELIEILKGDDLASKLLAAKFLAELTDSNFADIIKIALPAEEANSNSLTAQKPEEAKTLLITTIDKKVNRPLAGVTLQILFDGWTEAVEALTDEQGQYQIAIPKQDFNWFRINAAKEGYANMSIVRRDLKQLQLFMPGIISFEMSEIIEVGGIVQDEQFEPIEDAEVQILADFGDNPKIPKIDISGAFKTDVNGIWKCDTFPEDATRASLKVSHPNYVSQDTYQPATIEQLKDLLYITILEQGVTVTGRVLDLQQRPLQATIIKGLYRREGENGITCDEDGWFQFDNVSVGNEVFFAQCKGAAPQIQQVDIHPNMPSITFNLEPANTIRGKVVDVNDAPIKDVSIKVSSWQGFNLLNFETRTDANGSFQWTDAPAGEILFNMSKPGYLRIRDFGMKSENDYVTTLLPLFEISGDVLSSDPNRPVGIFKITIRYYQQGSTQISSEQTNQTMFSGNRYELTITEPLDFQLLLQADGFEPAQSPVFSTEQNVAEYDFVLTPLETGRLK